MALRQWEDLPKAMQKPEIKEYYITLKNHRVSLAVKRLFDIVIAAAMLIGLSPIMGVIAILIKLDSPGTVFYRQERVTAYGKKFKIHKFRTMISGADEIGTTVTIKGDSRITRIGRMLRKYRLDEFPQLFDILVGDMSFVGTRPEAVKYVKAYTAEMKATLLLPAGLTSKASICFKDEADLLAGAEDIDKAYVEQVLPKKMEINLEEIRKFSLFREALTMIRTVIVVFRQDD